jgi:hypothetical protein
MRRDFITPLALARLALFTLYLLAGFLLCGLSADDAAAVACGLAVWLSYDYAGNSTRPSPLGKGGRRRFRVPSSLGAYFRRTLFVRPVSTRAAFSRERRSATCQ